MVPMSYHSCREKLGNYLQIKVMLSDSSPHKYTTSVRYFGRQRQISEKQNKIKSKKRTAKQFEAVALFLQSFLENKLTLSFFSYYTVTAMVNFNKITRGKQNVLNHEVLGLITETSLP